MDRIPFMRRMHSCILKSANISRLRDLVIDPHMRISGNNSGWINLLSETTRYKLAGLNIPTTPNEKRLLGYKDLHNGTRTFIIGNGPSLNKCDLRLLKNEFTFGVNAIYLNYQKMGFYPTYYVVEDVFVAEDRAKEINSLRGPIKFFGNYLNYCLENSDDVVWLNVRVNYNDYPRFPYFSSNAARMVWVGGTVSYICLQLAYYMGFSEVYLVGFDHSYQVPKDAQVTGVDILSNSDDLNHFHPSYFGKGYRWHDPNLERMEKSLLKAKDAFSAQGRKIYNATVGGHLEIFERVEFASLFERSSS